MSRLHRNILDPVSGLSDFYGAGVPDVALSAPVGSTYRRSDGVAGDTLYQRTTTGWEKMSAGSLAISGSLINGRIPVATGASSLGSSQMTQYAGPDQIRSAVAFHPETDGVALGDSAGLRRWAISATTISASGAITQGGNQVLHAGNYNSYAPTLTGTGANGTWGINVTGYSVLSFVQDTRAAVTGPSIGGKRVRFDFLTNTTDGLNDGGSYHGVMTFQQWEDASGGGTRQLGFTDNDNLWIRGSGAALTAYNPWKLLLNSANFGSYALPLTGGTVTGNLGIGVTPVSKLDVNGEIRGRGNVLAYSQYSLQRLSGALELAVLKYWNGVGSPLSAGNQGDMVVIGNAGGDGLLFVNANAEKARISTGGFFKASNDGTYLGATGGYHELRSSTAGTQIAAFTHSDVSNAYGVAVSFTGGVINNGTNWFFAGTDTGGSRAVLYSNGDWYTARGIYGRLDDTDSYFQLAGTDIAQVVTGGVVRASFNASGITGALSGNATTASTLQTARTINGTSFNGSANIDATEWWHSVRDFPNGTLITTSIDYAVTSGAPFVLEIRANTYGNITPMDFIYQGYIYADTIINHGGLSNGHGISGLVALNVSGFLCFWFPTQGYWQGYNVRVYEAYATRATNKVTGIIGGAKPVGTKEVALSANVRQALHSSNFNQYALATTGGTMAGTIAMGNNTINGIGNLALNNGFTISQYGSYAQFNTWTFLGGFYGFYSSENNAYLYPNNTTYGAWRIEGKRNGYNGISFNVDNGIVALMVNEGGNITGFHHRDYGWQFYWENGTLRVSKGSFGGGTSEIALDSSNYTGYAGALGSSNTWTATNYFVANMNTTGTSPALQAYSNNAGGAIMSFHRSGQYAVNMGLDSDNVFRIGGWSAPANLLQLTMAGALTLASTVTAYDWVLSSDLRLKRNVTEVHGALGIVREVPGIQYWHIEKERWELGFGAQDLLRTSIGALTTTMDESGRYGALYSRTIPVLWQAVREQDHEVARLKRQVAQLQEAVRALGGSVETMN